MKTRDLIVALDQGSSSSRAIAFDLKGRVVAGAQRAVNARRPRPGWVEHDPIELSASIETALDAVLSRIGTRDRVIAAGLAAQRSTIVFCDRKSLKSAGAAPSWMDSRAVEEIAPLHARQADVHRLSGLYATPYYSAPKIRWSLDRSPKIRALAEAGRLLCAPVTTFLAARLTRGHTIAVDPTCAQRTLLMNLEAARWDDELSKMFGVTADLLPEIRPSAGDWGAIERKGRKIPLLATVGDQQAAATGLGADREGAAVINYGTGAFILRHTGSTAGRVPGLLTSCAPTRGGDRAFFLEGTVHSAGTSFEWLRDNFGVVGDSRTIDASIRRSRQRIFMLPAIGGLGAPRWDYRTKTALYGMDARTTRRDLARAAAEGVCMLIADSAEAMTVGGYPIAHARVSGGLARADAMMQLQADALGVRLERRRNLEATALGAAVLAARAAGIADADRMRSARVERTFIPRDDTATRGRRRADWTAFVAASQGLSRALMD